MTFFAAIGLAFGCFFVYTDTDMNTFHRRVDSFPCQIPINLGSKNFRSHRDLSEKRAGLRYLESVS